MKPENSINHHQPEHPETSRSSQTILRDFELLDPCLTHPLTTRETSTQVATERSARDCPGAAGECDLHAGDRGGGVRAMQRHG